MAAKRGKKAAPTGEQKPSAPVGPAPGSGASPSLVVGVGASAGGLVPLQRMLADLPRGRGVAVIVIQHLQSDASRLLVTLIADKTKLEVVEGTDEMPVQPDHVYVLPSSKALSIAGGTLSVKDVSKCEGLRMPIDHFFCTLAFDQGRRAVGVILSGSGRDGTGGLTEIKALGGVTAAQDPASAEYGEMPRNAIDAGGADQTLPPERLGAFIVNRADELASLTAQQQQEAGVEAILAAVHNATGHDFHCYKRGTLERRIHRRMALHQILLHDDYARMVRNSRDEALALRKDLMIGVTEFFRQAEAWGELQDKVIAPLIANAHSQATLRVWAPACSSGKEAYSLAILLVEAIERSGKKLGLQVFATDADTSAVELARAGQYTQEELKGISAARLGRFFIRKNGRYEVVKELRELIVFAPQDLTSDPPFSKLDLVTCRNLLIYLDQSVQKKIIQLFHFALREGGCLFLGSAETINGQENLFEPVCAKWRIYRKLGTATPVGLDLPLRPVNKPAVAIPTPNNGPPRPTLPAITHQAIAERFGPPAAVVDRKGTLLYLYGRVEDYLQMSAGEQTGLLADAAREGLRNRLASAVLQAVSENKKVTVSARVKKERKSVAVKVTVSPMRYPREAEGLLLVTFEEQKPPKAAKEAAEGLSAHSDVHQLEDELKITREELSSTIEQLEQSNEQLKAYNEEVTSANEELQSTNEELETSKEELQSLNEELNAVNTRLQEKVAELEQVGNDVSNLLTSGGIATIFLDKEMKVRRFTTAVTHLFSLVETDAGRHIADIHRRFSDETLLADVTRVLVDLTPASAEVQAEGGDWYLRRILPYRTRDDRIEGVVITFSDVTELKQLADALRCSEESVRKQLIEIENANRRMEAVMEALPVGVAMIDVQGNTTRTNAAFAQVWGGQPPVTGAADDFTAYKAWWPQTGKEVAADEWAAAIALARGEPVVGQVVEIRRFDGGSGVVFNSASPVRDASGAVVGAAVAIQDITLLRQAQQEREIRAELLQIVNGSTGTADLVKGAVTFFQKQSGCQAVGIRLKDGEDYPYYEARGFPKEFLRLESHLCRRDAQGQVVRDAKGEPVIECMCGNVIAGRTDPSKPFFTASGSFWTNCTTDLLASTTEADRQSTTRNRCNGQGYESVALVPLCVGPQRLGLIQLNDRRKGLFSPEKIAFWERLAASLAIALAKTRAEDTLGTERRNLQTMFDVVNVGLLLIDETGAVRRVNNTASRWLGRDLPSGNVQPGDFLGCVHAIGAPGGCGHAAHCTQCPIRAAFEAVLRTGEPVHGVEAEAVVMLDGKRLDLWLEVSADPLALEGRRYVILAMSNITARKQAEHALREAHDRARWLARFPDENPIAVLRVSADGTVLYRNPAAGKLPGWQCEVGQSLPQENLRVLLGKGMEAGGVIEEEMELDHTPYAVTVTPFPAECYANLYGRDITEHKQAEQEVQRLLAAVQEEKERLSCLLNSITDEVWFADLTGKFTLANPSAIREFSLGSSDGGDVAKMAASLEVFREDGSPRPVEETPPLRALAGEVIRGEEEIVRTPGTGELRHRQVSSAPVRDAHGKIIGSVSVVHDITERKRILEAVRQSEERYRSLFNGMTEGFAFHEIITNDQGTPVDYRFLDINPAFERLTGLKREEVVGKTHNEVLPGDDAKWHQLYGQVALTGRSVHFDSYSSALKRHYEVVAYRPAPRQFAVIFMDVTERKRAEEYLNRLNRTLKALGRSSQAMLRAGDEKTYMDEVCRIIIEDCGHAMVWVGFAEEDEARSVRPVAWSGFEEGYVETLQVSWADTERGRGPTGTAIRTGQPAFCRNMLTDPLFEPWRQEALARGYASSVVLPLMSGGKAFGALTIYFREPDPFTPEEVALLTELADDLALGITAFRTRTARDRAEKELLEAKEELERRVQERTAELTEAFGALRQTGAYTRSLIEASLDPLVTIGPGGTITDVNKATEAATGRTRQDLIGTDFSACFTEPDKAQTGYRRVFKEGSVRNYPLEIRHRDGRTVPVLYNAALYRDEAGEVVGIFAAARDITDLKQAQLALRESEVRYRTLFETMDEGFCAVEMIYDPEGKAVDYRFVEINPAFEKHTGLHDALGKTMLELVPKHDKHWFEIYGKVARTGEATRFENVAEAMQRFYDVYAFPIGGAENRRVGILFKDITDKKRSEEALREAKETLEHRVAERTAELARSNKDLEAFGYVASHDLQEPLRMVSGFLRLLEERYAPQLDETARQYIGYSVDGAVRMSSLIHDLLEYSRVERMGKELQPCDANEAVENALADLGPAVREAGAAVTHDPLPTVGADKTQLSQLFLNLIGNAVKFRSPERPCQVHVRAERDQGQWVFSVRDNGIGIDPKQNERVFQIFQRLHTRDKYPGTGIGLAICKKIVERHGGRIWIESKVGEGTTFYFTLPA